MASRWLDDITITANITNLRKKIGLALLYNVGKGFLYANGVNNHQFKAKNFEIRSYSY